MKDLYLLNLQLVTLVRARHIVSQRFGADKLMVRGRCGDNVTLSGNLTSKASNRTSDCSVTCK